MITTTGFASADFALWSPLALLTLVMLMFIGGCTGSNLACMRRKRRAGILDSKSSDRQVVRVRVPPSALRAMYGGVASGSATPFRA
jgi:trk system potassium uptake protein